MSASIAGDVIAAFPEKATEPKIIYTFCPDTGIKAFFKHYEDMHKAEFQLWKRIWRSGGNVEYNKKPLGLFTRKQVEAAGEAPVAQVVNMPSGEAVREAKQKVRDGESPYALCRELAAKGLSKPDALVILQEKFPKRPIQKLKGMQHSVWAQHSKGK